MNFGALFLRVFLLCLAGLSVSAQDESFDFNSRLRAACDHIHKLQLADAGKILSAERQTRPVNGIIPYLESYSDFFYFLISDDQKAYPRFQSRQTERLALLGSLPASSPFQRMLQAEMRLHSAFVKLKMGQKVSGSRDVIRAYRLLNENNKKFPDFVPNMKSLGLLHVMIGSVPEEYTWVARLIGLRGSIREGFQELETVQRRSVLFGKEAEVTALLLNAYVLQPDKDVLGRIRSLPFREPDNLLFHFLSASVLMKHGRSEEALEILQKAPHGPGYLPFPFLQYMQGEICLQKGRYRQAYEYYGVFLSQVKGNNFVKDSYHKQFLCKWLSGDGRAAESLLRRIPEAGASLAEADQHAALFADLYKAGKITDEQKVLYRARYATDGGYLEQALALLEGVREESFEERRSRAEFSYRKGRILQEMGKVEESIPYLKRALGLSEGNGYYYGAAAALQLGYIYRKQLRNDIAENYFRKALNFGKHEYKNSIDNKARAALTELGKQ